VRSGEHVARVLDMRKTYNTLIRNV